MKNNPTYTFSVLQYRHSQLLGEVLNVGLLVYFTNERKLSFIYPRKLTRLTSVYPNVQDKTIRAYLRSFAIRVEILNKTPEVFAQIALEESFVKFVASELIPVDSSALQFDQPRKGLLNAFETDSILNRLYDTYFSFFETDPHVSARKDDAVLITQYKTYLRELEAKTGRDVIGTSKRVQFDYVLKPTEGTDFRFDVAWQNGSLNLVKPVSFDVARPEILQNKAFRFYGQFLKLQDYATENNIRFDLLLAKPTKRELFKNFQIAVKLLEEPRHVNLVFEEDLLDYSERTLEELSHYSDDDFRQQGSLIGDK